MGACAGMAEPRGRGETWGEISDAGFGYMVCGVKKELCGLGGWMVVG